MLELAQEIRGRFSRLATTVAAVLALGASGYVLIEGWSWFDGLYMTVITLATVGYGEVHPLTKAGRAFTIVLIFFGIGILTWAISNLTAFIVEGELKDVLRRRRMEKRIAGLVGHYILCGAGHTGQVIIEELRKTGRELVVIEKDSAACERLVEHGLLAIQGDATMDEVLERAGIRRAQGLFAALTSDRDNAFVALTARGLNKDLRIVAEQVDTHVREQLIRSGASAVVSPHFIGGMRMASEMVRPAVVGFLDHMLRSGGEAIRFEEVVIPPGGALAGRRIGEVRHDDGESALVVAIMGADGGYALNPASDHALVAGETLIVLGTARQLARLKTQL